MLLTLTIVIESNNRMFDIQVNKHQKIIDTLQILLENDIFSEIDDVMGIKVKSARNEQYINVLLTYEQGNIFTGDILILM